MAEVKTQIVLEGQTRFGNMLSGLRQAKGAVADVTGGFAQGFAAADQKSTQLFSQVRKLAQQVQKEMRGIDLGKLFDPKAASENLGKLGKKIKELAGSMREAMRGGKGPGAGGGGGASGDGGMGGGMGGAPQRRGSFTQGFLQGILPGISHIDRGPGAFRQAGGVAIGRALSGAGALAAGGSGALGAFLGAIPGVGGLLGGLANKDVSAGGQALAYEREMVGLRPLLGGKDAPNLRATGLSYGMDEMAATRFGAELAASGAGTTKAAGAGFVGTAMAAQSAFGIGPQTSGAFALASRTGAMGASKDSSQLLVDSISQGMRLGLEGSDLQEYMGQMASDIQGFRQTGIPLQAEAMTNLSRGLMDASGMGAQRAQTASRGIAAAGNALGEQGPGDAMQMLVFQQAGFKGGINSYLKTKRELRENKRGVAGKAYMGAAGEVMSQTRGMGSEVRHAQMYELMHGIMSDEEVEKFEKTLRKKPHAAAAMIQAKLAETTPSAGSAQDLAVAGQGAIGGHLIKESAMANASLDSGKSFIDTMQNLDGSAQNVDKAFRHLHGALGAFTSVLDRAVGMGLRMTGLNTDDDNPAGNSPVTQSGKH